MNEILETVLLLALPASGKSEVRRYLELMPAATRRRDFHMGTSAQLDDYPYVHMMHRIDDELAALNQSRLFFRSPSEPFLNPRDWGTLIQMINEDYEEMLGHGRKLETGASEDLFKRLDRAATQAGAPVRLGLLDLAVRTELASRLEVEARKLFDDLQATYPETLQGKTLVAEFARGGPRDSGMPLPPFFGYQYSLSQLAPKILEQAVILYIWVSPEESRRKNEARTNPLDPGSILHHGVPQAVMMNDYGTDDLEWLLETSEKPGTVTVKAHGETYHLPVARFDNRVDKTSFLRGEQGEWKPEQVDALHEGLRQALEQLATAALKAVSA